MQGPTIVLQSASFKLAPSSAPLSDPNSAHSDALKSNKVKHEAQAEPDVSPAVHANESEPSALLQIPTPREVRDKLYEARAPPPLALPSHLLLSCPTATREDSESDYVDTPALPFSPAISLPQFPSSECETNPIPEAPAIILRPPSPDKPKSEPIIFEDTFQRKITRRYLSPAFVRGESLPFSIIEENEGETSESQYSMESALSLSDAHLDARSSATSQSVSQPSSAEGKSDIRVHYAQEKDSDSSQLSPQIPAPFKSESEAGESPNSVAKLSNKRRLFRQISPRENMKGLMNICRRLRIYMQSH
ncbi:hypothetical protein BDN70DRAFT_993208 [Pholiota conissans]|uniref:Uncharacterized protein n=1 Tax=Pholiota conissans TaxID=109636 RepID=A0A9P6D0Z3_9AGAR|nr:hypothetical protein BDN70DRAFT_993208 [Pholiota conissans]